MDAQRWQQEPRLGQVLRQHGESILVCTSRKHRRCTGHGERISNSASANRPCKYTCQGTMGPSVCTTRWAVSPRAPLRTASAFYESMPWSRLVDPCGAVLSRCESYHMCSQVGTQYNRKAPETAFASNRRRLGSNVTGTACRCASHCWLASCPQEQTQVCTFRKDHR